MFVDSKWYLWFNRLAGSFSTVILLLSLLSFAIDFRTYMDIEYTGFSVITAVLSSLHLLYLLVGRRIIERTTNPLASYMVGSFILMMNLVTLIHTTGRLHSPYHFAWLAFVFLVGIFGPLMLVGMSFITTLYLLLIATDTPGTIHFDPLSLISAGAVYVMSLVSYFTWRKRYVDQESKQIRTLSGQLKSSRQQAEVLIQSISDGMVVVMPNGQVSLMNPAAAKMTEWDVSEAIGIDVKLVMKLMTEEGKELPDAENPFKQVFVKKESITSTLLLVGRNGKQQTVSLVVSPVIAQNSEEVNGAVAVVRDISAARAEEKRRADFISTASHEMRTPVAAIEGYLALAMNDRVSSIDQKARGYLEKAHTSTQHLGKLFQDLLTSAKAEDGRLVNHPTAVEMGAYLEQLADSLRFSAEKKGLLLDFMIGTNGNSVGEKVVKPLYYVHVDPDRLQEVITNIFDNAVKYTERGKISIGLTGDNDVVQLYIRDTGPGIPSEDVPHLFQKFYRVDNSSTRTVGGTGLGLFICKKIIELYNGRIWVESEVGTGSVFYINLPRLTTQRANQIIAETNAQSMSPGPGPA